LLNKNGKCKKIPWNFGKFLVDSNGKVVDFYPPDKNPKDMIPYVLLLLKK
jgi:glutathione peroxidase